MADARIEGGELVQRLLARRLVHPGGVGDLVAIGGADVVDQLLRLARRLSRPMLRDVELADRLAETAVEHADAALPAGALLGNVVQRVAVETEARVIERLGQVCARDR